MAGWGETFVLQLSSKPDNCCLSVMYHNMCQFYSRGLKRTTIATSTSTCLPSRARTRHVVRFSCFLLAGQVISTLFNSGFVLTLPEEPRSANSLRGHDNNCGGCDGASARAPQGRCKVACILDVHRHRCTQQSYQLGNSASSLNHTANPDGCNDTAMSKRAIRMAFPSELIDHRLTFLHWPHDLHPLLLVSKFCNPIAKHILRCNIGDLPAWRAMRLLLSLANGPATRCEPPR